MTGEQDGQRRKPSAHTGDRGQRRVRTAVVVVHGMGEQLPLETLDRFVRTALPKIGGERLYYSRPALITKSFEARRHLAFRRTESGHLVHGQAEFFEYHWSYLMTGNRLADLLPTLRRLLIRRPSTVPAGLRVLWWIAWALVVLLAAILLALLAAGVLISEFTLNGVLAALLGQSVLVAALLAATKKLGGQISDSFVDVVRYLDRSPRSYEARRAIRAGMVDLLRALRDDGRYARIVVVAHSLGAFIAHDGLTSLWAETSGMYGGSDPKPTTDGSPAPLPGLSQLESAAAVVLTHPLDRLDEHQHRELDNYHAQQFTLWRGVRAQGNPWLVTDLVTVGTPMCFADLLYTRNRAKFDRLIARGEIAQDPPMTSTRTVEATTAGKPRYGRARGGRTVLTSGAPFAVVRWTNLYFPTEHGWFGDWFGGPLRPLFGPGVRDIAVQGNLPGRRTPGLAHRRYSTTPTRPTPATSHPSCGRHCGWTSKTNSSTCSTPRTRNQAPNRRFRPQRCHARQHVTRMMQRGALIQLAGRVLISTRLVHTAGSKVTLRNCGATNDTTAGEVNRSRA